jgi:hypothetical protein
MLYVEHLPHDVGAMSCLDRGRRCVLAFLLLPLCLQHLRMQQRLLSPQLLHPLCCLDSTRSSLTSHLLTTHAAATMHRLQPSRRLAPNRSQLLEKLSLRLLHLSQLSLCLLPCLGCNRLCMSREEVIRLLEQLGDLNLNRRVANLQLNLRQLLLHPRIAVAAATAAAAVGVGVGLDGLKIL